MSVPATSSGWVNLREIRVRVLVSLHRHSYFGREALHVVNFFL